MKGHTATRMVMITTIDNNGTEAFSDTLAHVTSVQFSRDRFDIWVRSDSPAFNFDRARNVFILVDQSTETIIR